jgi:hypothetical protein
VFNLNLNTSYVKRQCASEYRLFCKTLYRKRLTDKQLSYLHNSVLLPKVEYRLKATILSKEACDIISRPFKRLFKHALQLVSTFPTDILQYRQATNIVNLYHRNITQHCDRLAIHLNQDTNNMFSSILKHRIIFLQSSLYLPYSPLLLTNFSAFSSTKFFKFDIIFRTLYFAS